MAQGAVRVSGPGIRGTNTPHRRMGKGSGAEGHRTKKCGLGARRGTACPSVVPSSPRSCSNRRSRLEASLVPEQPPMRTFDLGPCQVFAAFTTDSSESADETGTGHSPEVIEPRTPSTDHWFPPTHARCRPQPRKQVALLQAAERGDRHLVRALVQQGVDVNFKNKAGSAAVHYAAGFGHDAILETLHLAGADMSAPNTLGWTPAHYAAGHQRDSTLRLLHSFGANLRARDRCGLTSAERAGERSPNSSTIEVLEELLRAPVRALRARRGKTLARGTDCVVTHERFAGSRYATVSKQRLEAHPNR